MRRAAVILLYVVVTAVWLAFLFWATPCPSGDAGISGMCIPGLVVS